MVEIGKRAPAFTLLNQDGEKVRLSDLKGQWVVLYFYPRDDTPGCTMEACDFTKDAAKFAKLDAVVLGCSPDTTESHARFAKKHKLKVELLSDPEKKVMSKYGAFGTKVLYGRRTKGVIRSTVLIDPGGKVVHHWARVNAKGHAEQVRKRLQELA